MYNAKQLDLDLDQLFVDKSSAPETNTLYAVAETLAEKKGRRPTIRAFYQTHY
jgi:hypothetical protein